jgi:hypothetical protein
MRITTNLIACVVAVQLAIGCSASLSDQCKQLDEAYLANRDLWIAANSETDYDKSNEMTSRYYDRQATKVESFILLDKRLKVVQKAYVEYLRNSSKYSLDPSGKKLKGWDKKIQNTKYGAKLLDDIGDISNEFERICGMPL